MVLLSFINPLSDDGKQIVRENGSLDNVNEDNGDLIKAVEQSSGQLDDIDNIPTNLINLSLKRLECYVKKTYAPQEFDLNQYKYLFDKRIAKFDVISFYILAQAIAIRFGPDSRESKEFVESQGFLIERRLFNLSDNESEEIIQRTIDSLDEVKWTHLSDLFSSKKLNLQELVLNNGNIILSEDDFMEIFEDKIKNRDPTTVFKAVIQKETIELIVKSVIKQNIDNYIKEVSKNSSIIDPHPSLVNIADEISKILKVGTNIEIKASSLQQDAFPPCIKNTISGVGSGNRNDAIVLLLTSFLSYARLYPSIFKNKDFRKVSDLDADLKITINEILPLIYDAANRCNPPLFEDDPQEKLNITAKLGFGVYEIPEIKHEGESKWYTPMSCDKIKIHLSSLCKPDATCKKDNVNNPLSYYNRKQWELKKQANSSNSNNNKNDS